MEIQSGVLLNGRYRLISEKGRGAFGEVWLSHDEQIDMDVAVKIYISLDERGLDEFKSEYKTAYTLNHPNLLHAYHFDIIEKRPFLVMPYCPESAESLIGTTDEHKIWKFIKDVASGLAYLHSENILHRDIKPDNILADSAGNHKITDFGISAKMKSTLRRNSTRSMSESNISGTIGYMAPELFTKTPEAVKATDIWALGATVFEIINGELPFYGQGGVMLAYGAEIPELKGNWSDALRQTVAACLAKDTWDRPTAEKLEEYATNCIKGQTVSTDNTAKNQGTFAIVILIIVFALSAVYAIREGSTGKTESSLEKQSTVIDGAMWLNYNIGADDSNIIGNTYTFEEAQNICPIGYRLPTKEELESLSYNYSSWTTYKGVAGRWFSGSQPYSPTTVSIFLPKHPVYEYGAYWSSTTGGSKSAYNLGFRDTRVGFYGSSRNDIFSVRCIKG